MKYASYPEDKPTLTEVASRALNYHTDLLERYYDLAGVEGISDEDKNQVLELAADLKTHTAILQNLMGKDGKNSDGKPDETNDTEDDEGDAFAEELTEDLSRKKAKTSKGEK